MGAAVPASLPASNAICARLASLTMASSPAVSASGGLGPANCATAARLVSTPSNSDVSSFSICPAMVVSMSW